MIDQNDKIDFMNKNHPHISPKNPVSLTPPKLKPKIKVKLNTYNKKVKSVKKMFVAMRYQLVLADNPDGLFNLPDIFL